MEVKLDQLIEKIKKEGVIEAKRQAEEIIKEARKKEGEIVSRAEKKAREIISKAEEEAGQFKINSENALRQAGRDLLLNLKERIYGLFDNLLKQKTREVFDPEYLKTVILEVIRKWDPDQEVSWEVLLSQEDKDKLSQQLIDEIKNQARNKGLEIKTHPLVQKGFRLGIKGEEVYYDFSEESVAEALKTGIASNLAGLLNKE